jgi:hypothetical protein
MHGDVDINLSSIYHQSIINLSSIYHQSIINQCVLCVFYTGRFLVYCFDVMFSLFY